MNIKWIIESVNDIQGKHRCKVGAGTKKGKLWAEGDKVGVVLYDTQAFDRDSLTNLTVGGDKDPDSAMVAFSGVIFAPVTGVTSTTAAGTEVFANPGAALDGSADELTLTSGGSHFGYIYDQNPKAATGCAVIIG